MVSDTNSKRFWGMSRISEDSRWERRLSASRMEDVGEAPGVWKHDTKSAMLSRMVEESMPWSRALLVV